MSFFGQSTRRAALPRVPWSLALERGPQRWCLPVVLSILAAVALSSPPGLAERAADSLPVFARLEAPTGTRLVLRGRPGAERAKLLTALAQAVQRDVTRRFLSGADASENPPVDVCLFDTTAAYHAFAVKVLEGDEPPSDLGFYEPRLRVVVANTGLSLGNLQHELAHALLGDDFPDVPSWLTEGVGSLYGSARLEKDGGYRFLVNYRLRHLRAAREAGTLPDLAALAASTPREVYGPNVLAYYAEARYLLLYLDGRGELPAFIAAMRAARTAKARGEVVERTVDEAKFLAWTQTLRLPEPRTAAP